LATYYNEIDKACCYWLEALMKADVIPAGHIDSRPIQEVKPEDLDGYTHLHFFAGIGGWAYAARLAGWPDDLELWTGSVPCQPFSLAGKKQGFDDSRHLWPDFFRLIRARRPSVVMGEQTSSAPGYAWLDRVVADLDGEDYSCRATDIPACSVGAPHIRNRLWWVSHPNEDYRYRRGGTVQVWRPGCAKAMAGNIREQSFEWPAESRPVAVAHGISSRVAKLSGFGNAIVPQLAAEVMRAYLETL